MTRLAILGIDGATFDIVRPMMDAGELPHWARLMERGVSGELESETPPITPPAWTSMMTGLNPGRHGVFHFIRRALGTYETPLTDASSYAGLGLSSVLGRRGWSSGLLNVPMSFPPQAALQDAGAASWVLAGIPCPRELASLCAPEGLATEITTDLEQPYVPDVDYSTWNGDEEPDQDCLERYQELRDELFRIERQRLELLRARCRRGAPDFLFTVVAITDRAQHWFWKFQDRSHAGWTQEGEDLYGEVIRDAYRLSDEFLGMLMEELGPEVPIAVVSDHGFGAQRSDFHINTWLEQQGLLVRKPTPRWTMKRLRRFQRVPVWVPWRKTQASAEDIDWTQTKAFCSLHGICINQRGREPEGIVEPAQVEPLLHEIEERLKRLVMPSGKRGCDFFIRAADFYSGPRAAEAPDLQFQMDDLACLPKDDWGVGRLYTERKFAGISGTHRFNGVFTFSSPQSWNGKWVEGMHIRHTAPTLLHALGEGVPSWMEGQVHEMLQEERPVQVIEEFAPRGTQGGEAFDDEEKKRVEESLRGLGYLQ